MIWVVLPLAATGPRPGRTPVPALNWLSTDIIIRATRLRHEKEPNQVTSALATRRLLCARGLPPSPRKESRSLVLVSIN